jgi:hypothetical protein
MAGWVVSKIGFVTKNQYWVRFVRAISKYMSKAFTKKTDLVIGCGINSKSKHY